MGFNTLKPYTLYKTNSV